MLSKKNQKTTSDKIINATLHEISESGIEKLTTKKISKRAETSTGIIHHYFDTKESLIFQSYKELINNQLEKITQAKNQNSNNPINRIRAVVASNFDSELMNKQNARAWTQLWAIALHKDDINKLLKSFNAKTLSIIEDALKELLSKKNARGSALNILALIHGYWIEVLITKNADLKEPINAINSFIDNICFDEE